MLHWAGLAFTPGQLSEAEEVVDAVLNDTLSARYPFQDAFTFGRYDADVHTNGDLSLIDIFGDYGNRVGFGVWAIGEENARVLMPAARHVFQELGIALSPTVYSLFFDERGRA